MQPGGFERQPRRARGQDTPTQPFLGNSLAPSQGLSGSCCGPAVCSVYVCVKPYVTSYWFFVLGFIFGLVFCFLFFF